MQVVVKNKIQGWFLNGKSEVMEKYWGIQPQEILKKKLFVIKCFTIYSIQLPKNEWIGIFNYLI